MGERMVRKLGWPPDNRVLLGLAILFIFLAIGQAYDALEATKTSSVAFHIVLCSVQLAGSAFYFLLWRRGRRSVEGGTER